MDVGDVSEQRLRERLANNNMLWFLSLALVVVGIVIYGVMFQGGYSSEPVSSIQIDGVAGGTYDPESRAKLEKELEDMARKRGVDMEAGFVDASQLELVFPSDTVADEMSFLSRFAAMATNQKFGEVPEVYVYTRNSLNPNEGLRLTAITRWEERERNFVARFQRSMGIDD